MKTKCGWVKVVAVLAFLLAARTTIVEVTAWGLARAKRIEAEKMNERRAFAEAMNRLYKEEHGTLFLHIQDGKISVPVFDDTGYRLLDVLDFDISKLEE